MSQNDGVFRLPPLIPNSSSPSSNSNSISSGHRIGYWKADSQTPITSNVLPTTESRRHRWQVRFFSLNSIFSLPLPFLL